MSVCICICVNTCAYVHVSQDREIKDQDASFDRIGKNINIPKTFKNT